MLARALALAAALALALAPWVTTTVAATATAHAIQLSKSGTRESVLPMAAALPDGTGTWVTFFESDASLGYYVLRAELVRSDGTRVFGPNGILVSAEKQSTALFGYDMVVEPDGTMVVVFCDKRASDEEESVVAYRLGRDGVSLWPGGLQLSANEAYEAQPRVLRLRGGELVFAWTRVLARRGALVFARVAPGARSAIELARVAINAAQPGQRVGFLSLVHAKHDDEVLAVFVDDAGMDGRRALVVARVCTHSGVELARSTLFDATPLPVGYLPRVVPLGESGALVAWHAWVRARGYVAFVTAIDGDGAPAWPERKVVSEHEQKHEHEHEQKHEHERERERNATPERPLLAHAVAVADAGWEQLLPVPQLVGRVALVSWLVKTTSGPQRWGVRAAAFDRATGEPLWGATGVGTAGADEIIEHAAESGCVVYSSGARHELLAACFDLAQGERPTGWPHAPTVVSSAASNKMRAALMPLANGLTRVVWSERGPNGKAWAVMMRDVALAPHETPQTEL